MKIALVHNFHAAEVPSGEDEVVRAEAQALTKAGLEVLVLGVHNDTLARWPAGPPRAAVTIATGIGISPARELGAFEPDVVHVHGLFPFLDRRWLRHCRFPIVATAHNYRPMCANGYLFRDGEVCTLCVTGRRWPAVRYGCYRSRLASLPHAVGTRGGAARDPLLTAARQVLVLSDRARSVFMRAGVPEEKLRLDPHFLPAALDPGVGRPRGGWVFAGRLSPEKGIDRLVAEWPEGERLRVIGDGDLRRSLEGAARGQPIEFLGRLPRAEVMQEVRSAFGVVMPSRWYETFGLVYIEALAAGVPTLAFRPNVVADEVEREGTGVIATWGAVDAAIAGARDRFDGLRDHCRQVFEDRYAEPAFVDRRLALYKECAT